MGKRGLSPSYDAVTNMLNTGDAYHLRTQVTSDGHQIAWMEETAALTNLCPRKPLPGSLTCLTRVDSTIKVTL